MGFAEELQTNPEEISQVWEIPFSLFFQAEYINYRISLALLVPNLDLLHCYWICPSVTGSTPPLLDLVECYWLHPLQPNSDLLGSAGVGFGSTRSRRLQRRLSVRGDGEI